MLKKEAVQEGMTWPLPEKERSSHSFTRPMKGHRAERKRPQRKKAILDEMMKMPATLREKLQQYKMERAKERAARLK